MTPEGSPSVAHVLWSGGTGGIERLVHQLALHQLRDGMTVSVAFGRARGPFAVAMRESGVPVIELGLRSGYDLRPGRIRRAAAALAQFDVIHLHAFNVPLGVIAMASGCPVVFTDHGSRPGPGIRVASRLRRLAQRSFLRRSCAEIAANSKWTAGRTVELYGIDTDRVTVVHNGIGEALPHDPTPLPVGDDRVVVSFVGRLAEFKRVDRLLAALSQARNRDRLRTLIVGEGPLEGDLKAQAARLGREPIVEFLGYRSDVEAILAATDILVQPSEGEPFGLAIIEACHQGALPAVFADGGGALEVLPPDGRIAVDEAHLARILDELCENPASRSPTARRARAQWAAERFPIGRTADAYLALYLASLARAQA
jgi:glycosyltransferase involved in cell wall biosynthesis